MMRVTTSVSSTSYEIPVRFFFSRMDTSVLLPTRLTRNTSYQSRASSAPYLLTSPFSPSMASTGLMFSHSTSSAVEVRSE